MDVSSGNNIFQGSLKNGTQKDSWRHPDFMKSCCAAEKCVVILLKYTFYINLDNYSKTKVYLGQGIQQ